VALTGGTLLHDDAALSTAFVARHLRLYEHPGEDLLLHHPHATPAAVGTCMYVPIQCSTQVTAVIAEHVLFDDELVGDAVSVSIAFVVMGGGGGDR